MSQGHQFKGHSLVSCDKSPGENPVITDICMYMYMYMYILSFNRPAWAGSLPGGGAVQLVAMVSSTSLGSIS